MRLLIAALCVASAFYWLAIGVGIPAWRTWQPGDATDIATVIFWAVILLGRQS